MYCHYGVLVVVVVGIMARHWVCVLCMAETETCWLLEQHCALPAQQSQGVLLLEYQVSHFVTSIVAIQQKGP